MHLPLRNHLPTRTQEYLSAKFFTVLLTLILLSIGFTFSSKAFCTPEQPLRIAVSSNFTPVLKKLLVEFHQQTQINTQIISGATGALFLQIHHGAPFDIFIAADSARPAQLEQQNLLLEGSRHTYALGQLALLSMNSNDKLSDLKRDSQTSLPRFAIANPRTAPYGKAAQQTLEHMGLWPQYKSKLIIGLNINQTFAQVRSQAVSRGLVANSQLVLNNLSGVIIPSTYHQPIAQQLAIIKSSHQIHKAKRLSEYLLSAKIQQKIVNFGYTEIGQ